MSSIEVLDSNDNFNKLRETSGIPNALVSIEFPGYVKNQCAALETMGGLGAIEMVVI